MRTLAGLMLTALMAACSGGSGGGDGGHEDGADGNGGDFEPIPYTCPFPFSPPLERDLGGGETWWDDHILCAIDFQDIHAQVLVKAVPTGMTQYHDPIFEAREAFVCRDGQVEPLPEGSFYYEFFHHAWEEMGVGFDGYKFIFDYAEWCVGGRPCNPSFEIFHVRRLSDDTPVAGPLPAVCSKINRNGNPLPLVGQARIPEQGQEVTFQMGSATGEADETPVHDVTQGPFRLDVREATNADFALFLNDRGNDCDGHPCIDTAGAGQRLAEDGGVWKPAEGYENHPVVHVTFHGADAYCMWRGWIRLPTEAQWELAASAAGTRAYPWGNEDPDCDRATHGACGVDGPGAVCGRPAGNSREGVCDLGGNVAEWVRDWYAADFYGTCTQDCQNPRGPENPTGSRVVRGGGFTDPAASLRATDRAFADPATSSPSVGVRCVGGAGQPR